MIFIPIAVIGTMLLSLAASLMSKPQDTREPYLRNSEGSIYALLVRGPVDNIPNHEDFIHDGSPHQNPVVQTKVRTKRFLFVPIVYEEETRWYPLTISQTTGVNLTNLQAKIHQAKVRKQDVELVTMPTQLELAANRRENQTQEGQGNKRLNFKRNGRPR